jgi:hypothetical protein
MPAPCLLNPFRHLQGLVKEPSLPSPSLPQSPSMPNPLPAPMPSLNPFRSIPFKACSNQSSLPSPSLPQSPSMPMPAPMPPQSLPPPSRLGQKLPSPVLPSLPSPSLPQSPSMPLPAPCLLNPFRHLQGLVKHPCLRHPFRNLPQCPCPLPCPSIPSATFKAWSKTSFAQSAIPAFAISPAIALNALPAPMPPQSLPPPSRLPSNASS